VTTYFADASALVKRYVDEVGSTWMRAITDPSAGNSTVLAEITLAEVAAALAAKQRASDGITTAERDLALGRFLQDCDDTFLLIAVNRSVIDRAVHLTHNYRLRGYDAVQLAAALVTQAALLARTQPPVVFVAADVDLLVAARAEGLAVENPLDHGDLDHQK
jgi:predicted nucleic acid-binding protein